MAGERFQQMLPSFAPLAGRDPHSVLNPFAGVPGFTGYGPLSMALQIGATPFLQSMMQGVGMTPTGLLTDQNAYDFLQNQAFTAAYRDAMAKQAEADRASYMRFFRGAAAMTGTPFGARQREAATQLADAFVRFTPLAAELAPDLVDAFAGPTGSATVMTHRMALASRYLLDSSTGRFDPTGTPGAELAGDLHRALFADGTANRTRGFRAGQVGLAYEELARRGMLPSLGSQETLVRAVADVKGGDPTQLSPEQLDKLKADPAVANRLKALNVDAVKRTVEDYTQALGAVRDLFGDMGRPDAPMSQLFNAIEALSNKGMAQLGPAQLASLVRQTREVAKLTGVGIDGMMALQEHSSQRAMALGLNPLFGVTATQDATLWAAAYSGAGGATPAWNKLDVDGQRQLAANRMLMASKSRLANQLAVVARVADTVGGFAENSTAAAFLEAAQAGRTEFIDPTTGKTRRLDLSQDELTEMLAGTKTATGKAVGYDAADIQSMLGEKKTNEEYIFKNRFDLTAFRAQASYEMKPWMQARYAETIERRLIESGVSSTKAATLARKAADAAVERLDALSEAGRARKETRDAAAADAMRTALAGTEAEAALKRDGQDPETFFRGTADLAYGRFEQRLRRSPFAGYESGQNFMTQMHQATQQGMGALRGQAQEEGRLSELLGPLNRGGLIERLVGAVQKAKPGDDQALTKALAEAFGGVPQGEIRDKMMNEVQSLQKDVESLQGLRKRVASATEGPERDKLEKSLQKEIDLKENAIRSHAVELRRLQTQGLADHPMTREDVDRVAGKTAGVEGRVTDVEHIRKLADPAARRAAFDRYWREQTDARATYDDAMLEFEGLASQSVRAENVQLFGPKAKERAQNAGKVADELRELAKKYTGGDLARLEAGDFDSEVAEAERQQAWGRVRELQKSRAEIAKDIRADFKGPAAAPAERAVQGGAQAAQGVTSSAQPAAAGKPGSASDIAPGATHLTIEGTLKLDLANGTAELRGKPVLSGKDAAVRNAS